MQGEVVVVRGQVAPFDERPVAQPLLDHLAQTQQHRVAGEIQDGGVEGAVRIEEVTALRPVGRLDHRDQGLVEQPDAVSVTMDEPREDGSVVYHLHVAEADMGRVIGKQGRIAKAIRVVMRAAATRSNEKVIVEID